jgi:UDP-N-acetylmuramoyl-L-alanyl-D-glutamate--2,6-diaminopimelate ligase
VKPLPLALPDLDWAAIDTIATGRQPVADSRLVTPGDAFLAFAGEQGDGRRYIAQALAAGAGCVLWEQDDSFVAPDTGAVPQLGIPALREQAGRIAAHLLGDPSRAMRCVGVTGTNGKTSITHWLVQAFARLGHKPALIGTLGYGFLGALEPASHTTPDAVRLQNLMARYRDAGATHLAMEVSSHALAQGRTHGVTFEAAVFTNLTRDHLDYHGDMATYGATKARLFDWEGLQHAVINADDDFGATLLARLPAALTIGYGIEHGAVRAESLELGLDGLRFDVATPWGRGRVESALVGRFNVLNLLACLAVLLRMGVPLDTATAVLGQIESAQGRMQRLGGGAQPLVIVDYAHTPDALENALTTLRHAMAPGGRLICVFGCGGDRDRGKRPQMGHIACTLADTVVITSDNPRTEDPKRILADIVAGVDGAAAKALHHGHYSVESDRARAIESAISLAQAGDVVLIAGKGHEAYQDIAGVKHPFSDEAVARAALAHWAPLAPRKDWPEGTA